ncbi:MOSC domain-containing protein [Shewanella insulae]|uniref:MOSC domain-containing protein n=1 Tax=Shewanella insulae TaxID=2681496 RepID=A0A6L7HXM8_9GAMM|nr:MOSC domain-containing protein [Shewanella insulae]MCG9712752.1 MOSC domain-containing protein [Shewanella insulae]MCG9739303.1 MOSC domain-containing protein [Shewanella insulae]MXR68893.1 MOSC domain-containing protein [Shewanella insulae]
MASLQGISYKVVKGGSMLETSAALVTTSTGVAQDVFGKPGKRQVTLLSAQQWQDACQTLDTELPWTTRRANLLIDGISFSEQDLGKVIQIGALQLEITGETDPCKKMEMAYAGLEAALQPDWRGGVTCRVLNDAEISIGDSVHLVE